MDIFQCPDCGAQLFFHNLACVCGGPVVFDPDALQFRMMASARPCANRDQIGCNWQADGTDLCRSCAMTRTRPDLAVGRNLKLWAVAEQAKRRVLFDLMHWGLFTPRDRFDPPVFDLLAEETREGEAPVSMGHAEGVITINVTRPTRSSARPAA